MSERSAPGGLSRVSTDPDVLYQADNLEAIHTRRPQHGFNARMLSDDLAHKHYAYETRIEFDGIGHSEGSQLLGELLNDVGHNDWWPDVGHYVWDLVQVVCDEMLQYGRCVFEVYLADKSIESTKRSRRHPQSSPEPKGRADRVGRLGWVPGWSIRDRPWGASQAQSVGEAVEWVRLPKDRLVTLKMPDHLNRRMRRTYRELRTVDRYHLTGIDLVAAEHRFGYDFSFHQRVSEETLARCTADIGWDGRGLFDQRATSAHLTYRRLRFLRTWLAIVNASIAMLNRVTVDPRFFADKGFTLELKGLPTVAAVNTAIDDLLSGRTTVDPVWQELLFPKSHPPSPKSS